MFKISVMFKIYFHLQKIHLPLPAHTLTKKNTTQLHFVVFRVEELAHKLDNILSKY